jgi:hypothetical protein
MGKDALEMPDMSELAEQMEDAMAEAQRAMEELPMQLEGMEEVLGSLSALMGGMPTQMEELGAAVADVEGEQEVRVESLAGDPDWLVEARIQVGEKLDLIVRGRFDLGSIKEAWSSTQGESFEALVAGVIEEEGVEIEEGQMDQIVGQLKRGRSIAVVEEVKVLACRIQGAPGDARETLQLSPEGNIPLAMGEEGIGFEFAPLLTIRNRWERADIPTFSPMGEEIIVPLEQFDSKEFEMQFEPQSQEDPVVVKLSFQALD